MSYAQPVIMDKEIEKGPGLTWGSLVLGDARFHKSFVWNILRISHLLAIF
jgi:hypothetical protein